MAIFNLAYTTWAFVLSMFIFFRLQDYCGTLPISK